METVDARGLKCPWPVLRLEKHLRAAAPGAEVELLATDPVAWQDIPRFAEAGGHALLGRWAEDGGFRFRLRRG